MTKHYSALPTLVLKADTTYFHPIELPEVVHWDDAAVHAMIDFKYLKPATINPEESVDAALLKIKASPFHVLLVVNREQKLVGLISAEDLLGEKPLKALQERGLPSRAEVLVRMLMIPQNEILTIDFETLRHAKIGHVVETLHGHKQHYALVVKVDSHTGVHTARGLFSSSQISKQLGENLTSDLSEAHSIAELQHHLSDN